MIHPSNGERAVSQMSRAGPSRRGHAEDAAVDAVRARRRNERMFEKSGVLREAKVLDWSIPTGCTYVYGFRDAAMPRRW